MSAPIITTEEEGSRSPNLDLAQLIHRFENNRKNDKSTDDLKTQIMKMIEADSMVPFYESVVTKYGWTLDESLLLSMK